MTNISTPRDNNRVPALIGVSSSDGSTPTTVYVDPTTHRVLVDATGGLSFADSETPSGAINGSNVTYTLAHTPSPAGSLILTVNGQVLAPVGVDFTLSTATITMNTAPPSGSSVLAWYRY